MSFRTRDLATVDFSEIDELIAKLTPEEIELLNNDVDPDVSSRYFVYTWLILLRRGRINVGRFEGKIF